MQFYVSSALQTLDFFFFFSASCLMTARSSRAETQCFVVVPLSHTRLCVVFIERVKKIFGLTKPKSGKKCIMCYMLDWDLPEFYFA